MANQLNFMVNARDLFIEGECYLIEKANVSPYSDCVQLVPHQWKLNYNVDTNITRIHRPGLPNKAFSFVSFSELIQMHNLNFPFGIYCGFFT